MSDQIDDGELISTALAGYVEFEFDLPEALLASLVDVFSKTNPVELSSENVKKIPEEQGVYQLFLDSELVYVGKTDADAGLRIRLLRHSTKIVHRKGLDPKRVSFKAVRVFVFTAMDLESDLIRHYGGVRNLSWNGSGFGSNDPGKERDTTRVKSANFDAIFPIDIDYELDFAICEGELASEAIARLKGALPYTLRYQNSGGRSRKPHADFERTSLRSLKGGTSVRFVLEHIISHMPPGWHATVLPGYIIMYKNDKRQFPSGTILADSPT